MTGAVLTVIVCIQFLRLMPPPIGNDRPVVHDPIRNPQCFNEASGSAG